MAKLNVARRITKEDFAPEDQALIERLGSTLNQFIEQVVQSYNKNFTIEDNLPFELKTFNLSVDATGKPKSSITFTGLKKIRGCLVVRAENIQNTTSLTGAPFCQFVSANGTFSVSKVTGLPADTSFSVTLLLIF